MAVPMLYTLTMTKPMRGNAETRAVVEGTALPNGYQNHSSPRRCHNGMV